MEIKEFEEIVIKTIENLPDKFKNNLKNIDIVIEDGYNRPYTKIKNHSSRKITLGLYQGLPITKRAGKRSMLPDKITIYKKSLEAISSSKKELRTNIRKVILHEIGHHFGLDDEKLKNLGY